MSNLHKLRQLVDDEVLSILDELDVDERNVDKRIEILLQKHDLTVSHLKSMLVYLKYKYMICLKEETDCDNDIYIQFIIKKILLSESKPLKENTLLLEILSTSLLLNQEKMKSLIEHILQQVLSGEEFSKVLEMEEQSILVQCINRVLELCLAQKISLLPLFIMNKLEKLFQQTNIVNMGFYSETVPLLMKTTRDPTIFNIVWENVLKNVKHHMKLSFTILCTLCQYYIPLKSDGEPTMVRSTLVEDPHFWLTIKSGFSAEDCLVRKCAAYLVKRVLTHCEERNVTFNKSDDLFYWDTDKCAALKKSWNAFITLLETFEEKQSGLVLSAMKLFDDIGDIHYCWWYVAIETALSHSSTAVMVQALLVLLSTNSTHDGFSFLKLCKSLNNCVIFENYYQENKNPLRTLLLKFLTHKNNFLNFMKNVATVKLAPIPRYYVYSTIAGLSITNLKEEKFDYILKLFEMDVVKSNINDVDLAIKCFTMDFIGKNKLVRSPQHLVQCVQLAQAADTTVNIGDMLWKKLFSLILFSDKSVQQLDKSVTDLIDSNQNIQTISTYILLIVACNTNQKSSFKDLLHALAKSLTECGCQLNTHCDNNCHRQFSFIVYLLGEISQYDNNNYYKSDVQELIQQNNQFKSYVFKNLQYLSDVWILDNRSTHCLEIFCNTLYIFEDTSLINQNIEMIQSNQTTFREKYFAMRSISCVIKYIHDNFVWTRREKFNRINRLFLPITSLLATHNFYKNNQGDVLPKFLKEVISIYVFNFSCLDAWTQPIIMDLHEKVLEFLQVSGAQSLADVIHLSHLLLPKLKLQVNIDKVEHLIKVIWTEMFSVRKSGEFVKCVNIFMKMMLEDGLPSHVTSQYCNEIFSLGEQIPEIILELMRVVDTHPWRPLFSDLLMKGLLFGKPLRRDQRIEKEILNEIATTHGKKSLNSASQRYNAAAKVRIIALNFSLSLNPATIEMMITSLMTNLDSEFNCNHHYHCNSSHHRTLLRTLQFLCLSWKMQSMKFMAETVGWCVQKLITQPHHASCRILLEWYICLYFELTDLPINEANLKEFNLFSIRQTSLYTILFHALKYRLNELYQDDLLIDETLHDDLAYTLDMYLESSMGKTFSTRLHAQYFTVELLQWVAKVPRYHAIVTKYKLINEVITKALATHKNDENLIKIQQDFYQNSFDDIENVSLTDIYYYIPILTNVAEDECIALDVLNDRKNNTLYSVLYGYYNTPSTLESSYQKYKRDIEDKSASSDDQKKMASDSQEHNTNDNIQKKFIPWQKFLSDINMYKEESLDIKNNELIVVASLIDRYPNIGGLSRTCEVFGVQEYTLSSLQFVQDKRFQNISMSSEKWLNITEVTPENLKEYILKKRSDGYAIIAAEQTSSSVSLHSFQFPKKSLLLIGHEKDGIPCDLISLMDHCVEIPQHGMIRSLNVHVTASVFIWEYTKQHPL